MKVEFIRQEGCKQDCCHHHRIESVILAFAGITWMQVFADGTIDLRGVHQSAFGYKATLDEWIEGLLMLYSSQQRAKTSEDKPLC